MTRDDPPDDVGTDDDPDLWIARRHADPDDPLEPADPDERRVVAALDRTRADLAAHAARTPAMPPGLRADLARALADPSFREGHAGRNRAVLVAAVAAVGAAIALGVAVVAGTGEGGPVGDPTVATPPVGEAVVLRRDDGPAALRAGLGRADYGPLADPGRRRDCLAAHAVPPGTPPIGVRQVVVDGVPGVLVVLPTGVAARFRVLVVGEGCSSATPLTVSDRVVGR